MLFQNTKLLARVLALLLVLSMLPLALPAEAAKANVTLDAETVYNTMIALQKDYPEGMRWTNDNYSAWKGGINSGGYGCAGFAFILSDAVFGDLPARTHINVNDIRAGDILRINNDTHSVVVLKKDIDKVTIAEGNYGGTIHWGRSFSWEYLVDCLDYVMTRYPEAASETETCKLTFKKGTGTGSLKAITKDKGTTVTITKAHTEAFTRKGYLFAHFADADGKEYKAGSTIKLSKNITLTAKYTKVKAPTAAVTSLKLTSTTTKQLKVTYKKVSGAGGYRIQYATDKNFKNAKAVYTTKTSYTLKNLTAKKRYYVRITAYKLDSQNKRVYSSKQATKNLVIK